MKLLYTLHPETQFKFGLLSQEYYLKQKSLAPIQDNVLHLVTIPPYFSLLKQRCSPLLTFVTLTVLKLTNQSFCIMSLGLDWSNVSSRLNSVPPF